MPTPSLLNGSNLNNEFPVFHVSLPFSSFGKTGCILEYTGTLKATDVETGSYWTDSSLFFFFCEKWRVTEGQGTQQTQIQHSVYLLRLKRKTRSETGRGSDRSPLTRFPLACLATRAVKQFAAADMLKRPKHLAERWYWYPLNVIRRSEFRYSEQYLN